MKWMGIRSDITDIVSNLSAGTLASNTRFRVNGEMRLRRGVARTNLPKEGGIITGISTFSPYSAQPTAIMQVGSTLVGYPRPRALWGDNDVAGYVPITGLYGFWPMSVDGTCTFGGQPDFVTTGMTQVAGPNGDGFALQCGPTPEYDSISTLQPAFSGSRSVCAWMYFSGIDTAEAQVGVAIEGCSVSVQTATFSGAPFDAWCHVALVKDEALSQSTLYINGVSVLNAVDDYFPAAETNRIVGRFYVDGGGRSGTMGICDVAVFNKAITASEVATMMGIRQ